MARSHKDKEYTKNTLWLILSFIGIVLFGALFVFFSFYLIFQLGVYFSGNGVEETPKRILGIAIWVAVSGFFLVPSVSVFSKRRKYRQDLLQ